MEEEIKNPTIDTEDTYENADVKALQEMQARYDAELAKRDQKYSALLKYATEGGKISAETPTEPSPAEKRQHIEELAKAVRDNKMTNIDQAKALLEFDDYVKDNGGRTIFTFTDGTPTQYDIESAGKVRDLLQYAIDTSEGSTELFQAAITSKLKDIK